MKLSVAIPVFNEKDTIREILKRVSQAPLPAGVELEIVAVDDCSTDGTRAILKDLRLPNLKVFFHEKNQGKGAALRTAFRNCSGDMVLIQDADLEYDPQEYPKLIAPILAGDADVVYGSRFAGGEAHRVQYFWHYVANRFLTTMSNAFTDLNLTDVETCYKVLRREVLSFDIEEKRFGVDPEITAKMSTQARERGIAVYEVGISYHGRTYAQGKKIGARDAFRALWCIVVYNTSLLARLVKYAINALLVAAAQFVSVVALVEALGLTTSLALNLAYAAGIELSILVGFLLHARITWRYRFRSAADFLRKLLAFHLASALSFAARQVVFCYLQRAGMDYRVNTLIGIAIAVVLIFFGYDRLVFRGRALPAANRAGETQKS
jgi:glycosyltransferase involved in cell wall biosynthesis